MWASIRRLPPSQGPWELLAWSPPPSRACLVQAIRDAGLQAGIAWYLNQAGMLCLLDRRPLLQQWPSGVRDCAWCGDAELHVSVDVLLLCEAPCLAKGAQWKSVVCSVIAHVTTRVDLPESHCPWSGCAELTEVMKSISLSQTACPAAGASGLQCACLGCLS